MKPIPTHYDRAASITRGINWRGARILYKMQQQHDDRLTKVLICVLTIGIALFLKQIWK
jgi:hypothetical protein